MNTNTPNTNCPYRTPTYNFSRYSDIPSETRNIVRTAIVQTDKLGGSQRPKVITRSGAISPTTARIFGYDAEIEGGRVTQTP